MYNLIKVKIMKNIVFIVILLLVTTFFVSCNTATTYNETVTNDTTSVYMPNGKYTIYDAINM